jgi:hypothetical protein
LMSNNVHLLLETTKTPLSKILQRIHRRAMGISFCFDV